MTPAPDDVADIMFTSGTTGTPKGVVIAHAGLSSTDRVPASWLGLGFMTSSPFATTSGSLLVSGPLRGGLSGWFLPRFDADRWIRVVEQERPVSAFLVPAMVELIVASRASTQPTCRAWPRSPSGVRHRVATLRRFGLQLSNTDVSAAMG